MYFSPDDSGRVLVVFRNGQTKVAFVPMSDGQIISELSRADIRMEYAQPAPGGLFGKLQERVFEYGIPGCLILGVVLLVKSWYKSRADADDRKKIREMELQEKKDRAAAATQERTESLQNAVREKEKRRKEQQAQGEEEEGEADPLASATSFLSTTAQVTVSKYQEFGNRIGFPDVAGLGEARAELEEIVTFLRNPELCPRAFFSSDLLELERLSWRERQPEKRVSHSFEWQRRSLSKCLWESGHRGFETCSLKPGNKRRLSYSSMN